jgi:hypothetical protein
MGHGREGKGGERVWLGSAGASNCGLEAASCSTSRVRPQEPRGRRARGAGGGGREKGSGWAV